MELGLEEKVILVTGGASGIGGDIVKKLQDLGATPIVLGESKSTISVAI